MNGAELVVVRPPHKRPNAAATEIGVYLRSGNIGSGSDGQGRGAGSAETIELLA